jgi:hypothetical protein
MAIYEWYIPGCKQKHWRRLPWVSTEVAFENLRYWHAKGVRWITYESQTAYEDGDGYPRRWPLYYPAAAGMWDREAEPGQVLADACRTLYGPAAEAMTRFFSTAARAMEQTQVHGSIWNLPSARAVYRPEVRAEMREALARALQAAADHPKAWQRVAREVELWHESERTLESLEPETRNLVDARAYNGGIWYTERDEADGTYLRDLVGVGAGEDVSVVGPDGEKRPLRNEETYGLEGGVELMR